MVPLVFMALACGDATEPDDGPWLTTGTSFQLDITLRHTYDCDPAVEGPPDESLCANHTGVVVTGVDTLALDGLVIASGPEGSCGILPCLPRDNYATIEGDWRQCFILPTLFDPEPGCTTHAVADSMRISRLENFDADAPERVMLSLLLTTVSEGLYTGLLMLPLVGETTASGAVGTLGVPQSDAEFMPPVILPPGPLRHALDAEWTLILP
jgi:hypothetical protein